MLTTNIWLIVGAAGLGLVVLLVMGLIVTRMYRRASKETAFVKTGWGGEKVILDGGALVLPVLHETIKVNMQTLKLTVTRENEDALITKDRMRVDVEADFYLRVKPDKAAVAKAAQTLGTRTMDPRALKELMDGKFVDALRAVAASMSMENLHEERSHFVQEVQKNVTEDLEKNGLELESVSLTSLDQTSKEHFNPDNAFDAQGLTKLTETIEAKRKIRNDLEQDAAVAIEEKNLEAKKKQLTIERDKEYAISEQAREVSVQKSQQATATAKETAENDRIAKEAHIAADQAVKQKEIQSARAIEEEQIAQNESIETARIKKEKAVEIANQDRDIEIAEKSKAKSQADKEANVARADAVAAEEKVITARDTEIAERTKTIEIIAAQQVAERDATRIKVDAAAKKTAAQDIADAAKIEAQGQADAVTIRAEADKVMYQVEADGIRQKHEAENTQSAEIVALRIKLASIENAPAIIAACMKPVEAISDMKVINVAGLGGLTNSGNSAGGQSIGSGNFTQQLLDGLLQYKVSAPVVDSILKEIGIDTSNVQGLTKILNPKNEEVDKETTDETAEVAVETETEV